MVTEIMLLTTQSSYRGSSQLVQVSLGEMAQDPASIQDCPVDPALGTDDPNNVFTCKITEECCTVSLKPACCAQQDMSVAIMDQLALWCPLLAVIFLLSLFIWWCRTDEACCDVEKPCLYRFGCKKYPQEEEDELTGSQISVRSSKSVMTTVPVEDEENAEVVASELEDKLDNPEGENEGDPPETNNENTEEPKNDEDNNEDKPDEPPEGEEDGDTVV